VKIGELVGDSFVFNSGFFVIDSELSLCLSILAEFWFFFLLLDFFFFFVFDFGLLFLSPFMLSSYTLYGFPFYGNAILLLEFGFFLLSFFLVFMA